VCLCSDCIGLLLRSILDWCNQRSAPSLKFLVGYFKTLSLFTLKGVEFKDDTYTWLEKDFERCGCSLINLLSPNLPEGTEKIAKNNQYSRCPGYRDRYRLCVRSVAAPVNTFGRRRRHLEIFSLFEHCSTLAWRATNRIEIGVGAFIRLRNVTIVG
jgi:hypothetical protein